MMRLLMLKYKLGSLYSNSMYDSKDKKPAAEKKSFITTTGFEGSTASSAEVKQAQPVTPSSRTASVRNEVELRKFIEGEDKQFQQKVKASNDQIINQLKDIVAKVNRDEDVTSKELDTIIIACKGEYFYPLIDLFPHPLNPPKIGTPEADTINNQLQLKVLSYALSRLFKHLRNNIPIEKPLLEFASRNWSTLRESMETTSESNIKLRTQYCSVLKIPSLKDLEKTDARKQIANTRFVNAVQLFFDKEDLTDFSENELILLFENWTNIINYAKRKEKMCEKLLDLFCKKDLQDIPQTALDFAIELKPLMHAERSSYGRFSEKAAEEEITEKFILDSFNQAQGISGNKLTEIPEPKKGKPTTRQRKTDVDEPLMFMMEDEAPTPVRQAQRTFLTMTTVTTQQQKKDAEKLPDLEGVNSYKSSKSSF